MSGEEEHDDPRGSPDQGGEACPDESDGVVLRRALMIAGSLVAGVGLLVGCAELFPNLFASLFPSGIPGLYYICSSEDEARAKISTIEKAAVDYRNRHGDYPPSLGELTAPVDGMAAYLDKDSLMDPWGTLYRYDLQQREPTTDRPKIFTLTPKGKVLSNW
jgi:hypothetical protein